MRQFEVTFDPDDFIVSKTDLTGKITYANHTFIEVAGYREVELLGAPHSLIRHRDMPRAVFKLLWDRLTEGAEVFAYVKNQCKDPDRFYWVFAHVTPSRDGNGNVVGYHSVRRVPDRRVLEEIVEPFYHKLRQAELDEPDRRRQLGASFPVLAAAAKDYRDYDEWIFSL